MRNFVQKGDTFQVVAPAAVTTGVGFLLAGTGAAARFVVAMQTAASGGLVEVLAEGIVDLPKAAVAIALGDVAYWDDTAKNVTNVVSTNTKIGIFIAAAVSGASTGRVRLNGAF
jgi:predicted RecA/RadA family phage recombinase